MATTDMFGVGGEGLGGLFVGNQMAMQREAQALEQQKGQMDMANTAQIMQQRALENQFNQETMPDRIAEYRSKVTNAQQDRQAKQFADTGEKFGQLGTSLGQLPPVARPAALKQMANQAGIQDDNPLLQHLMNADPEQLPNLLTTFSKGFYEQSDKSRAEAQKRDAMMAQAQAVSGDRLQAAQYAADARRDAAQIAADARRDAASIAAAVRGQNGGGNKPLKESYDNFITRTAREQVEAGNWTLQEANEYVQRAKLNQSAVRSPDTAPAVMAGATPTTPAQRVDSAVQGSMPGGKQAAPAAQKFQEGKVYQDANGNKAKFVNGKWEAIGASNVPK